MIIPESVKLVYCYFGNGIALGVYGSKDNVDVTLNGLYNYNAHDDQPRYLSDGFGYVLTTKEKLKHGIANMFVTDLKARLLDKPRKARHGIWPEAERKAKEVFDQIKLEPFLEGGSPAKEYEIASQTEL